MTIECRAGRDETVPEHIRPRRGDCGQEDESTLKPNTAVTATTYKGAVGQAFSFQLVNAAGTHELKPAEVSNPRLVKPTCNGAVAGKYTFIGLKPGKTKVQVLTARADNLAVGVAEVDVEITEA